MNPVQRPDSFEAADYVGVLRRRWWVILALAVVGLVGAFGYVLVAPKVYTATSAVDVTPTAADQGNSVAGSRTNGATVNLDTQAQVVTGTPVSTLAGKMMHSTLTPYQLAKQITVTVPPNSSILNISCDASTALAAATCANDFANAYLTNRRDSAVTHVHQQVSALQAEATHYTQLGAALTTKMNNLAPNSPQRPGYRATILSDTQQASKYSQQAATAGGQLANTDGGSVNIKASPPGKPSKPKKTLILPSGLVAGLLLGLLFALLIDRRDKRIHSAQHVERLLDLPVLLDLPPGAFGREVSIASPRSKTGQAFTDLGHAVAAALGEGNHIVFVSGATPGPAGSVVAANLAVTLARTHSDVVLVCANLNSTVAAKLLGLGEGEGLAELVAGSATVRDVVRGPAGMPGLWVITPGADPSLANYHLQYDTARALTSQLRRDARYVVIEAPVTDDGADTFGLGEFADAALVTIELERTTKTEANDCVRRLRRLRTPVLGAAVMPAIGARVAVRPPRQPLPRVGSGPGDLGRDGISAGRGHAEISGMSSMPVPAADTRDRSGRSRDGHGRADSVSGS
jgi:capsular polysaccharide biosynthesis protein